MPETAEMSRSVTPRWQSIIRDRRVQTVLTLGIVLLGPLLAVLTFIAIGPLDRGVDSPALRAVLLADLFYVLIVAALVLFRVVGMLGAKRRLLAGARLHARLTGLFALIALGPAVLVAVFAGFTINIGVEGWFSERVRQVVGASLEAAEAYEGEHRRDLVTDAVLLADFLDRESAKQGILGSSNDGSLRLLLVNGQRQIQRGLREAFIIDSGGEIRARGERSYLFDYERPSEEEIARAVAGETVLIADLANDEFRALIPIAAGVDRLLYVSREVDGEILSLLDQTQESARLYQQLDTERGRILFEFGLVYLGFVLILVLAAVWLGLWFAERISRPVGRLAGAAQQVGAGDLDARVADEGGDDEIAMLGQSFNRMTRELKGQRDALIASHRETEVQRRLFDSVLSSVTAGVVGLDAEGRVAFANPSARRLLDLPEGGGLMAPLGTLVPEFGNLLEQIEAAVEPVVQDQIRLTRRGKAATLLVRIATRSMAADGRQTEGLVVVFDDVTDLVSAQRVAAWGDVARRIAHEIKNPLTPIQLSAERIRRKFGPAVGAEGAEALGQYIDVIVRQTGDLRRIVDEFSRFARMPEPDRKPADLVRILRDALLLQESGQPEVRFVPELPEGPVMLELDSTMMSQALTNLLKNAGEAIMQRGAAGTMPDAEGEIRLRLALDGGVAEISIADNGIGLPEDRAQLFEPYVTHRPGGTGLGLPIVRKIIEEHGGTLVLIDAEPFGPDGHRGACAVIRLPVASRPARGGTRTGQTPTNETRREWTTS